MYGFAALRFSTALAVLLLAATVTESTLISVVICLSFGHIILALYYSWSRVTRIYAERKEIGWPILAVLVAVLVTMIFDWPSILFYFWLHHTFNEYYFQNKHLPFAQKTPLLITGRYVLETAIYFSIARQDFWNLLQVNFSEVWLTSSFFLAVLFFAWTCFRTRKEVPSSEIKGLWSVAAVGIAFSLFSLFIYPGTQDHIILYHFTLWSLYPIGKMRKMGGRAVRNYVFQTIVLTAIIVPFTPLMFNIGKFTNEQLSFLIRMMGFFHISTSYALSEYHPQFIRNLFKIRQPNPTVPLAKAV